MAADSVPVFTDRADFDVEITRLATLAERGPEWAGLALPRMDAVRAAHPQFT
jgi:hypothetical protein